MEAQPQIKSKSMDEGDDETSLMGLEVIGLYFGRDKNNKINNGKPLSANQQKTFLRWMRCKLPTITGAQRNSKLSMYAALKQILLEKHGARKIERKKITGGTSNKKLSAVGIPFKRKGSPPSQLKLQEADGKGMDELEDLLKSLDLTSKANENLEDQRMED